MSSHRVTRLSVTPVKGMRMRHPDEILLGPEGARGDRDFFFLADDEEKPISVPRLGVLVQFTADFDPAANRLTIRHEDGRSCEGVVVLGDDVRLERADGRELDGNVVEGPWASFVAQAAGRPLRLIKAAHPGAASDAAGVTLLGSASLKTLAREAGLAGIDARRFRMLIEIETAQEHIEDEWDGEVAEVGEAAIRIGGPVPRCAATTRDPERGQRDVPTVKVITGYRGLADTWFGPGAPFGVYADVVKPGRVRLGDMLRLG